MKKKVCIVAAGYKPIPPVNGGAVETIVQNFINLNEKNKRLDMTVLTPYNLKAKIESDEFKETSFVFFRGYGKIDSMYYWFVYKVLKKFLNIILPDYLLKRDMFRYLNENQEKYDWIIIEGGEIDCLKYYSKSINPKKIIYHSHGEVRNEKELEESLNYYFAVSDYINKIWSDTVSKSSEYSVTINNGINQEKFGRKISVEKKHELRCACRISDSDIVLVFVGRVIPEKGVKELLLAVEKLPANYKLLIVGSANFGQKSQTKYETAVERLVNKLESKVIFSGYISNDKIADYYQIGDISVVPSMFDDPAPLVIIEAMAAGLPIVTTGSGGIKEYCNNDCACFVERDEKIVAQLTKIIKSLGENEGLRRKMGRNSLERAKKFTDIAQYTRFADLLEKLDY